MIEIRYDTWRGQHDRATMLIKRLFKWGHWRIDLHCMIDSDPEECFHTHPAYALRLVLWGGYIEELSSGERKLWFPLRFGLVTPSLCHRVVMPIYKRSYSLWFRAPCTHDVHLIGEGWKK